MIAPINFLMSGIPRKNITKHTRVKFASLVFMQMNIHHSAKYSWSEHQDRGHGLVLSKHLDQSTKAQNTRRHTIEQINICDSDVILAPHVTNYVVAPCKWTC